MAKTLTRERIKELLLYNSVTGKFFWKERMGGLAQKSSEAGSLDKQGYRIIKVDGSLYKSHRLAWLYFYGVWPTMDLDHINSSPDDNRIVNLRETTNTNNQLNKKRNNSFCLRTSKHQGVSFDKSKNKWRAKFKGKMLGDFDSEEKALACVTRVVRSFHKSYPIPSHPLIEGARV